MSVPGTADTPVSTPKSAVDVHHGDSRDVLKTLADNSVDFIVTDLAAGTAAEHLVCADLLLSGYRAFLTDQTCPYDVAVDVPGRLVRVQVKATRCPRAIPQRATHIAGYMWHVRRAGKGGRRVYAEAEFDLLALVALDARSIAYLPPSRRAQTIHIRPYERGDDRAEGKNLGKYFSDFPFSAAAGEVLAHV